MDFVGPINPPSEVTGTVYILLVVDYLSRFVFATPSQKADQQSMMRFFINHIVPIVGWPKSVYSDNGSHFAGSAIREMWKDGGVLHFTTAISHPQSVGLSERYVQMVMGWVCLKCISAGSSKDWGLHVKDAIIDIKTRCVCIHGYTPSEILLGFNAVSSREPATGQQQQGDGSVNWMEHCEIPTASEDTIHVHVDRRDEQSQSANLKLAHNKDNLHVKGSAGYKEPKPGDLVLVRNIQLAKEKGKNLEPRWSTPRLLERISRSGVSGHIRQLPDPPGQTKRYHIDDLIPYLSRNQNPIPANTIIPVIEYSQDSTGSVQGNWSTGQRAFDLSDDREKEPTPWEQIGKSRWSARF